MRITPLAALRVDGGGGSIFQNRNTFNIGWVRLEKMFVFGEVSNLSLTGCGDRYATITNRGAVFPTVPTPRIRMATAILGLH